MQAMEELRQFHEFVGRQLQTPDPLITPEECLARWRQRQRAEYETSRADIEAALHDMEQGDAGTPAAELMQSLRKQVGSAKTP